MTIINVNIMYIQADSESALRNISLCKKVFINILFSRYSYAQEKKLHKKLDASRESERTEIGERTRESERVVDGERIGNSERTGTGKARSRVTSRA